MKLQLINLKGSLALMVAVLASSFALAQPKQSFDAEKLEEGPKVNVAFSPGFTPKANRNKQIIAIRLDPASCPDEKGESLPFDNESIDGFDNLLELEFMLKGRYGFSEMVWRKANPRQGSYLDQLAMEVDLILVGCYKVDEERPSAKGPWPDYAVNPIIRGYEFRGIDPEEGEQLFRFSASFPSSMTPAEVAREVANTYDQIYSSESPISQSTGF